MHAYIYTYFTALFLSKVIMILNECFIFAVMSKSEGVYGRVSIPCVGAVIVTSVLVTLYVLYVDVYMSVHRKVLS